jgi:hypothetical protein
VTLYKVLDNNRRSCNGGDYEWTPGEWTPPRAVDPCHSGWHLCDGEAQLLRWLGKAIWTAEARGDRADEEDKIVVESARIVEQLPWDERQARLFACDCAARVLHLCADDEDLPRVAIEIARAYAIGKATREDLAAAARDAAAASAWDAASAWASAWAAARDAARGAEAAWQAARLRWYLDGCPVPVPAACAMVKP